MRGILNTWKEIIPLQKLLYVFQPKVEVAHDDNPGSLVLFEDSHDEMLEAVDHLPYPVLLVGRQVHCDEVNWDELEGAGHPSYTLPNSLDVLISFGSSAMGPYSSISAVHTLKRMDSFDSEGLLEFSFGESYYIGLHLVDERMDLLLPLEGVETPDIEAQDADLFILARSLAEFESLAAFLDDLILLGVSELGGVFLSLEETFS